MVGVIVSAVIAITVNALVLCAVPPAVATVIRPETAAAGTLTTSCVVEADCTGAATPPIVTWLLAGVGSKLVPVMVTYVPRRPATGVKLLVAGGGTGGGTVNAVALVAVPPRVVTAIRPVVAPPRDGCGQAAR
jgi:hypothetical protein